MLLVSFLSWWYGPGWMQVIKSFQPRSASIIESFSFGQLIKTWFEPWKRIITYPGDTIGEKFKAWGDNAFSRMIGFVVRTIVMIAGLMVLVFSMLLTIVQVIIWPLVPPAIPILIILGVIG